MTDTQDDVTRYTLDGRSYSREVASECMIVVKSSGNASQRANKCKLLALIRLFSSVYLVERNPASRFPIFQNKSGIGSDAPVTLTLTPDHQGTSKRYLTIIKRDDNLKLEIVIDITLIQIIRI